MPFEPLTIKIAGRHDTGKTTVASLIRDYLAEAGFTDVKVADVEPLSVDEKDDFEQRLARNRERPIRIEVELLP